MPFLRDRDAMTGLLTRARRIAVVGCSSNPERDSHRIAKYLIEAGYEVIPVNPAEREILGRPCFPDAKSIPQPVDIVDVFRKPEAAPGIVEDAIAAKAGAVWLQQGITHPEAEQRASEAGLDVVSDACIMVVHTLAKIPRK
ncbi:MAG: CoA-binding protein [Planctomycetes bacterium]|nr:CoA-binding protein [Planctomycetota bacterium]